METGREASWAAGRERRPDRQQGEMAARLGHTMFKGLRGPQKVRVGFGLKIGIWSRLRAGLVRVRVSVTS